MPSPKILSSAAAQARALVRDEVRIALEAEQENPADSWAVSPHFLTPDSFSESDRARFMAKVSDGPIPVARPDLGECALWTAAVDENGGGRFRWQGFVLQAYRAGYVIGSGLALEPDKTIDHLCRVRRCVRWSHLEPVSMLENMRRADENPSTINRLREACENGHPFDDANTLRTVQNGRPVRKCKACSSARYRAQKAARHAAPRLPRPSREVLEREIRELPFTALGVRYGVSDNGVRVWARALGIELPKRGRRA